LSESTSGECESKLETVPGTNNNNTTPRRQLSPEKSLIIYSKYITIKNNQTEYSSWLKNHRKSQQNPQWGRGN